MIENLKQYVKERDEMLLKRDVGELRKFAINHKHNLNPDIRLALISATDEVLEITLHKMIVNCTNLPFNFRQQSADWLLDRGYNVGIGGEGE